MAIACNVNSKAMLTGALMLKGRRLDSQGGREKTRGGALPRNASYLRRNVEGSVFVVAPFIDTPMSRSTQRLYVINLDLAHAKNAVRIFKRWHGISFVADGTLRGANRQGQRGKKYVSQPKTIER